MKMKHLFEEITPAHVPDTAVLPPSSSSSTDDQEMGSNSMPMNRHVLIKKSSFCSFLQGMDLNPARMVSNPGVYTACITPLIPAN